MKKGRFLWSAHRITKKQKAGKARNIKEKQLKNSRSTASKPPVARLSSASDNRLFRLYQNGSKSPEKSRFSGLLLYLNGLIWFDQIWQNESRFHPIFSGPQVVNWLKRGQKEGEVVPKVVNREPIFGVLFSPPSPRFLAVAVWHSLS